MIVLSLFDGASCGRLALERAGIFVTRYFASEIDKHAIKVVKTKWPDTICIGNVEKVRFKDGVLYTENGDYPVGKIDLLIGGSPCQGFSFAGEGLAFDDPRSKLFFEYERIRNEIMAENPKLIFFLENVRMKIEHERVITERMGVYPVNYNSNLVSAQNRDRLYWTNIAQQEFGIMNEKITGVEAPRDKGIVLKDVLLEKVHKKYFLTKKALKRIFNNKAYMPKVNPDKTGTINTKNNSGQLSRDSGTTLIGVINDEGTLKEREKANCIDSNSHKGMDNHRQRTMVVMMANGVIDKDQDKARTLQVGGHGAGNHSNMNVICVPEATEKGFVEIRDGEAFDATRLSSTTRRGRKMGNEKTHTVIAQAQTIGIFKDSKLRRLTPIECCRLQNIPDDYFFHNGKQIVSDTQIYKMVGNGWTIDMIAWFFKHI